MGVKKNARQGGCGALWLAVAAGGALVAGMTAGVVYVGCMQMHGPQVWMMVTGWAASFGALVLAFTPRA